MALGVPECQEVVGVGTSTMDTVIETMGADLLVPYHNSQGIPLTTVPALEISRHTNMAIVRRTTNPLADLTTRTTIITHVAHPLTTISHRAHLCQTNTVMVQVMDYHIEMMGADPHLGHEYQVDRGLPLSTIDARIIPPMTVTCIHLRTQMQTQTPVFHHQRVATVTKGCHMGTADHRQTMMSPSVMTTLLLIEDVCASPILVHLHTDPTIADREVGVRLETGRGILIGIVIELHTENEIRETGTEIHEIAITTNTTRWKEIGDMEEDLEVAVACVVVVAVVVAKVPELKTPMHIEGRIFDSIRSDRGTSQSEVLSFLGWDH